MTPDAQPDTREYASAFVAGAAPMLVVSVVGVVRIPLLYRSMSLGELGAVLIVVSLCPLLLATTAAARNLSRNYHAEIRDTDQRMDVPRLWPLVAAQLAVTAAIVLAVPDGVLASLSGDQAGQMRWALLVTGVVCAVAISPGWTWGAHEAMGRYAPLRRAGVITPLLLLGATVAALGLPNQVFVQASIGSVAAALPYVMVARRRRRMRTNSVQPAGFDRLMGLETLRSSAPLATRSLDTLVIGAIVGPAAVPAYTIAARMAMLGSLGTMATRPYWASRVGRARASVTGAPWATVVRAALSLAALAAVGGLVISTVGFELAERLVDDRLDRWLFVLFAAMYVIVAGSVGVALAFAGRRAAGVATTLEGSTALVNLVLTVVLVHLVAAQGAVIASIVGATALLGLQLVVIRRRPDLVDERLTTPESAPT